ncbi:MAG: bacteriohemerythrin [Gallionella sp.]
MKAFVWNARFETGIASVDEQHQRLVEIVNRIGNVLIAGNADEDSIGKVFTELAGYATYHFADEERLMAETGVSASHIELHRQHHRQFVEQLTSMWKGRADLGSPAEVLHGFLSSWLTFHILEEDQSMARQIAQIHRGETAEEAFRQEQLPSDQSSAVLLSAMHQLYRVLSLQNQALAESNTLLEQKVDERTRELLQSGKMAAIGQLAAGVAHEINNPVGFVNSNLATLRRYAAQLLAIIDACAASPAANTELEKHLARSKTDLAFLRDDLPALLNESQEGLDRVTRIVQALKDFAHADPTEMQDSDLLAGLESTLDVVWNELRNKAEIARELAPLPPVRCIPGQINQVFMNLLLNAVQAIESRGIITLQSGHDDKGMWIAIADSGCGMTEDVRKHLFEPFFTTRPVGQGTGLGLSVSWDIVVNKHGGRIDVESEPGKGSRFTVWLPLK